MSNVIVFDHPLIQHKLTVLRKTETGSKEFRELITEISMLMCYEVTRDIELEDEEIVTAMGVKMIAKKISGKKLGIIPILRAGLGMVDGFLNLIPTARVGHIG
ncbi:MAG: uracil phosphoribosyltransferase, partial [Neofamilia sp.]